jgi:hypothetical protein
MAKTERTAIGKTLRFNIFKRDLFSCQYCGATPPSVVLEIDHIHPVSKGGTNDSDNLITACFDCNRGKRDKLLTSKIEGRNIELIQEKEAQYLAFVKLKKSIQKRINKEIEEVSDIYSNHFDNWVLSDAFKNTSVKMFIKKLGVFEVKESMYKACAKSLLSNDTIKYFCGICHNKIRDNE